MLGGLVKNLPTDLQFILERGYLSVTDFLNESWKNPHPCYFVWVRKSQLKNVVKADNPAFPYEVLKYDEIDGEPAVLLKASSSMFNHFDVSKRIMLNSETGWLIKKIYKRPKKAENEFRNIR